jgi:L-malate glycosyltransferase
MKKVTILNKSLQQYRKDFYYQLKDSLAHDGIELELIYAKNKNSDALKKDEVEIEWAKYVPNKTITIGKTELLWQPCLKYLKGSDLVIVESANKLLINYYLMVARYFSGYKLAFWGHGRNLQEDVHSFRNKFKYLFLKKCDWWFGYTQGTKDFLMNNGYPENKITVVMNAIDTVSLRNFLAQTSEEDLAKLREELGITHGRTGIYCGALYPEKNFDFILEACHRVKKEVPDFHMIFVGSGVESGKIMKAAEEYKWIHYVGPKFGKEKVKYFKVSTVQLMPYYVGLGIVDSFALEAPIITTKNPYHGPEIEYLENGINGILTEDAIDDYSKAIIDTLKSEKYLDLIEGCKLSSGKYTVEAMAQNFRNGLLLCLKS